MITLTIRCDPIPGKEEELDTYFREVIQPFWQKQNGVTAVMALRDKLVGYPERVFNFTVKDMKALQDIIDSAEWHNNRRRLMTLIAEPESQILEPL